MNLLRRKNIPTVKASPAATKYLLWLKTSCFDRITRRSSSLENFSSVPVSSEEMGGLNFEYKILKIMNLLESEMIDFLYAYI